jgi:hypothetical protein
MRGRNMVIVKVTPKVLGSFMYIRELVGARFFPYYGLRDLIF